MEIKYNVQAPPKGSFNGGVKSEEVKAIEDFLTSGNAKNMCFEYETDQGAKKQVGYHFQPQAQMEPDGGEKV